jgi:ankyrin repeat protein
MKALAEAIAQLDADRMNRILQSGANVNVFDSGCTPLQWACLVGNLDAVKALLQLKADPNLVDKAKPSSALHLAADVSAEIVDLLCNAGAWANARNDVGMTPVMVAAKGGHLDIVTQLVKHGADLRVYDDQLRGPLHWSAIGGNFPALNSYLIGAGAEPEAVTAYGKSYEDILETLRSSRAGSTRR